MDASLTKRVEDSEMGRPSAFGTSHVARDLHSFPILDERDATFVALHVSV